LALLGVRGTFSQPGPSRPTAAVRLARTLGRMNDIPTDILARMRRLFLPGPATLFVAGWWGTSSTPPPALVLGFLLVVSVPCSLLFAAASLRAFKEQNRRP